MKRFAFVEATPFIEFIKTNEKKLLGCTLKKFHTLYWPEQNWTMKSEKPVVLEIDNYCVAIHYFVPSDIEIFVEKKEIAETNNAFSDMMNIRNEVYDYYEEEFGRGVKKERIENCVINRIEVERFSESFEIEPTTGKVRPDGGDYFSTIRIYLDSGLVLCLCGAESICDGYIYVWCE